MNVWKLFVIFGFIISIIGCILAYLFGMIQYAGTSGAFFDLSSATPGLLILIIGIFIISIGLFFRYSIHT